MFTVAFETDESQALVYTKNIYIKETKYALLSSDINKCKPGRRRNYNLPIGFVLHISIICHK